MCAKHDKWVKEQRPHSKVEKQYLGRPSFVSLSMFSKSVETPALIIDVALCILAECAIFVEIRL